MRRSALLGGVVCAGLATFAGCATASSTSAPSEPNESVTIESIQTIIRERQSAISACYEDYVRTFGGRVAGEREMTPADDGPTQLYGQPWEGGLTFEIVLVRGSADVVLVESSTKGDADLVPEVRNTYTPPANVVTCIIGQLESAPWPTVERSIEVRKNYIFLTDPAAADD